MAMGSPSLPGSAFTAISFGLAYRRSVIGRSLALGGGLRLVLRLHLPKGPTLGGQLHTSRLSIAAPGSPSRAAPTRPGRLLESFLRARAVVKNSILDAGISRDDR